MSFTNKIKGSPLLKSIAQWLLISPGDFKPRLWIKILVNPFKHHRGKGGIVRRSTRMDVFPFNEFELGVKSIVEDFATINNGVGAVFIGNNTIIGLGCTIIGPVKIGNGVMLAQNVVVSGLNHGYEDISKSPSAQPTVTSPIEISDDVWIGANCVITAGVSIGRHAVIGAGTVVTKDLPPYSVSVGNPAKIIKLYNEVTRTWDRV